jgi:nitrogen fixation/metabolism regulation signal transduction histidine kinase
MANVERRRKYLVNRKLQLQFALLLFLQAAIPIILLGCSLYIVNKIYLFTIQRMIGEWVVSDVDIQAVLNFSVQAVLALLLITGILLTFIGIRFSHHVAGPLYKLEETLDKIIQGERIELLHFRKTDAVQELAEKFNTVIKRLNLAK